MTAANITARTLPATPTITFTSFLTALKTSMQDAGFSANPFDQFIASGYTYLVYQVVNDANKTFGTVYLQIKIYNDTTNNTVKFWSELITGYSISTHSGTGTSGTMSESSIFSLGNSLQFYAILHSEIKGIYLTSGTQQASPILLLRPAYRDTWWDEAITPWAFLFYSYPLSSLYGLPTNYYVNNTTGYKIPSITLSDDSNSAFTRSVWPMGVVIFANGGIPGYFQDLRQAAAYNLSLFSRIESPSQSWIILSPGNGGLVLLANPINVIS